MAIKKTKINQAYSPDKPLQSLAQEVIVANRAPKSGSNNTTPKGDLANVGQIWCDQKNLNSYILTGYSTDPATKGQSVWTQIDNTGGSGSFTSITVSGDSNLNGPIKLPYSTAGGDGVIYVNNTRFIHDYSNANNSVFFGLNAGNLTNTSNNSVGIGNSALINITTGNDNIGIGTSALSSTSTGAGNVALGTRALLDNNSNWNTAIGYQALENCTNAQNTAVGYEALNVLTTGTRNVAVGYHAGQNPNVNDSVFIGYNAQANGGGSENTHIGSESGLNNNGNQCVAVGMNTLSAGNGGASTAVGFEAGQNATGANNTAVGWGALKDSTAGNNTAVGTSAGLACTSGSQNTYIGASSGSSNQTTNYNVGVGMNTLNAATTGAENTAVGTFSQALNISGSNNVSHGRSALANVGKLAVPTTSNSYNTAVGYNCLGVVEDGEYNIGLGYNSGSAYTTTESSNIAIGNIGVGAESNVIRIGTNGGSAGQQNKAFIAGIRGVTTAVADAIPVLIDSAHQLGTVSSSERYKENIVDLADQSSIIYDLKPKAFNLKAHPEVPAWGLIAEEVDKVFPQLCVYKDDQPETVKYHELPVLLLNELQKLKKEVEELKAKLA